MNVLILLGIVSLFIFGRKVSSNWITGIKDTLNKMMGFSTDRRLFSSWTANPIGWTRNTQCWARAYNWSGTAAGIMGLGGVGGGSLISRKHVLLADHVQYPTRPFEIFFVNRPGKTFTYKVTKIDSVPGTDIAIGKFGFGLNVNLLNNTKNGAIRSEDWNESYDWARLIRYIRYGHKRDKFYSRVGTLDAARLGHGFIMNYYTNEASFDKRKIGLEFDVDFGTAGFETVTNNLGRFEVFGARAYARPLKPYIDVPLVKDLTFGATYVTDVDPDSRRGTEDGIYSYGLDVELPLIRIPMLNTFTYFDWAKIDSFGSGIAFGIEANLRVIAGVAEVSAKLERRILGKEFIPSYFDAFYEIQRFDPQEIAIP